MATAPDPLSPSASPPAASAAEPDAAARAAGCAPAPGVPAPVAPAPDGDAPLIVRVDAEHRKRLAQHLLRLEADDRFLRFGYHASDDRVRSYVRRIDLEHDDVFAVLDADLQVVAAAHVAYVRELDDGSQRSAHAAPAPSIDDDDDAAEPSYADDYDGDGEPGIRVGGLPALPHDADATVAEFGVSVDRAHRGQGLGYALMQRAVVRARSRGVQRFYIQALAANAPMVALARKAGMTIEHQHDEVTGYLLLPPTDYGNQVEELLAQRDAEQGLNAASAERAWRHIEARIQAFGQVIGDVAPPAAAAAADAPTPEAEAPVSTDDGPKPPAAP
jgi:GNAT superfamily N-acetyltransferase